MLNKIRPFKEGRRKQITVNETQILIFSIYGNNSAKILDCSKAMFKLVRNDKIRTYFMTILNGKVQVIIRMR